MDGRESTLMTVSEVGRATGPDSGTRAELLLKLELAARCVRTLGASSVMGLVVKMPAPGLSQ